MPPLDPEPQVHVFHVTRRLGVWQVKRDGVFFGDYLTHGNAVRGAYSAARFDETLGLIAQVFEPPGLTPLPHNEPHLGA